MKTYLLLLTISLFCQISLAQQERGYAALYGKYQEGSVVANKEKYSDFGFTGAHRSYPFGTRLRVTNINNGKSVVIRINDRGVLAARDIVTLSGAAARALGINTDNRVEVTIDLAGEAAKEMTATTKPKETVVPLYSKTKPQKMVAKKMSVKTKRPKEPVIPAEPKLRWTPTTDTGYELYQVSTAKLPHEGYGIQLAVSQYLEVVMSKNMDMQNNGYEDLLVSVENSETKGTKLYKLFVGPYYDIDKANEIKKKLIKRGIAGAFVVNFADKYLSKESVNPVPLR